MKCPMMFNSRLSSFDKSDDETHGYISEYFPDCIGRECAAYMEQYKYIQANGKSNPDGGKQWSCAMMPREVWIDVEESE